MATAATALLLVLLLLVNCLSASRLPSPYISPSLFSADYNHMLQHLKIFAYAPIHNSTFNASSPADLFHRSLLRSPFLTSDPDAAHLFYLTSPLDNKRHLARTVRSLRTDLPFWNRALGADHFYLTENALEVGSDRNLLELRKNSIQISLFPSPPNDLFVPHKDLTLPPLHDTLTTPRNEGLPPRLAFYGGVETPEIAAFLADLGVDRGEAMSNSRFCLFVYGKGMGSIGDALRIGCVPVVLSDRAVVDLPFGDVLRWSEMAIVARWKGGAAEVRRAMEGMEEERYTRMREMGMSASEHFRWSRDGEESGKDVFRTVLYQLWRRRHVIRYSAWDITVL